MCENCKHITKNEIKIDGIFHNGCKKSRKDLLNDVCDSKSEFCKNINKK